MFNIVKLLIYSMKYYINKRDTAQVEYQIAKSTIRCFFKLLFSQNTAISVEC